MKIVFMGTPEFAVPTLQRLIDAGHEIALILTQPDRPSGRGKILKPTPIKELALANHLRVEQPETLKGSNYAQVIRDTAAEVCVVAAYGLLLPPDILQTPPHGCLNVHASLLPRWRGAAPIQRAIMAGDLKTGVTIMRMDVGMDTGAIIRQEELDILPDDDALSVSEALSVLGADLIIRALEDLARDGRLESYPQDESLATRAMKVTKEEGWIDWGQEVDAIICRIHGLRPWPSTFSRINDKIIKIVEAEPEEGFDDSEIPESKMPKPGTIVDYVKRLGPVVRVGDGYLLLTKVQPENKAVMSGEDWHNGGGFKISQVFQTEL